MRLRVLLAIWSPGVKVSDQLPVISDQWDRETRRRRDKETGRRGDRAMIVDINQRFAARMCSLTIYHIRYTFERGD